LLLELLLLLIHGDVAEDEDDDDDDDFDFLDFLDLEQESFSFSPRGDEDDDDDEGIFFFFSDLVDRSCLHLLGRECESESITKCFGFPIWVRFFFK